MEEERAAVADFKRKGDGRGGAAQEDAGRGVAGKKGASQGSASQDAAGRGQHPQTQPSQPNPMAKLLEWAGPARGLYALSVLLAIVGVAGNVAPYYAAGRMIAGVIDGNRDFGFYQQWCLFAALAYALYIVCHHASTSISHAATFATIARMRRVVADKLARVQLGYVLDTPSGKLKNVMVERLDAIEVSLAHVVPEMTSNLVVSLVVVVYLFILNWILALVSLIVIPIGMYAYMQMMVDYDKWYGNTLKTGNDMASASVEYVNGIEVIKAFGRSASSYEKFSDAVFAYAHSYIDWMAHCQIWQDAGLSIAPASLVTVLPVGCGLVMLGWLDPATLALMAVLSLSIFPPIYAAIRFIDSIAQVGTVVGEISEVLAQPEQVRASRPARLDAAAPAVELDDVRFSYAAGDGTPSKAEAGTPAATDAEKVTADASAVATPGPKTAAPAAREVIHGVTLTVPSGSVTALVGPSGAGKSTLARLVAGLWDATSGTVRVEGARVQDMTADQLASQVSYVAQDNYLFDDTVMENIRMGRPGATDEEVIACAKASGCDGFIRALEYGYQTRVGGAGGHLSGGERQRVAIARAMLADAPIVILDEATAYMDPENEAEVEQAVSRLVAGKTLVVIAHRLSTVTGADKIVVIDEGRIAATGTHTELMAHCPLYHDMFEAHIGAKDEVA